MLPHAWHGSPTLVINHTLQGRPLSTLGTLGYNLVLLFYLALTQVCPVRSLSAVPLSVRPAAVACYR